MYREKNIEFVKCYLMIKLYLESKHLYIMEVGLLYKLRITILLYLYTGRFLYHKLLCTLINNFE